MSNPLMNSAAPFFERAARAPDGMELGHQEGFVITRPSKTYGHLSEARVLSVHHWTERLFSFTCTRDASLRFENGQFAMIGLEVDGKPLLRAYSIASANYEDHLEFLSIKVPSGPLTSRLAHIQVGDSVLVGRKPTGTLLLENLRPGRNLYLLATGTGLAPFMSLIKDPVAYERFERVVLTHTVRQVGELAYVNHIRHELPSHEFLGELGVYAERGSSRSLAQKLIALTTPGIPDVYQGTELGDDSLVDPDNRRPVDYPHRRLSLDQLDRTCGGSDDKLLVVAAALNPTATTASISMIFVRMPYSSLKNGSLA